MANTDSDSDVSSGHGCDMVLLDMALPSRNRTMIFASGHKSRMSLRKFVDSQRSPTTPVSSSSDAEVPVTPEPPGSSRAERKQGTEGLRSQGKCPHRSVLSATEVPGLFPNELLIVRRGAELWMNFFTGGDTGTPNLQSEPQSFAGYPAAPESSADSTP